MLFNSVSYLFFFPLVLAAYWFTPRKFGQPILLTASYLFYMNWIPVYGLLIFALTAINYVLGLAIDSYRKHSKALLWVGIVVNLGALCYFKYADFFLQTLKDTLAFTHSGLAFSESSLRIVLPLAISFFVFEFIHYLVDVARGDKAIRNPVEFALFPAFFPSQIAGPIKRFQDFSKQCSEPRKFDFRLFDSGLALLLKGLFKKVALADNLATIANTGFANSAALGGFETWLAVLAFTFQIYFDFSGYTDMGRGSAMMLGFTLPENFNLPYIASNLSDFWKRWHISLSSWLRDYVYIPLGGGRCSRLQKHINLMVTMLLGGLWHGAAWHYVVWGGIHGSGLVVSHEYSALVEKQSLLKRFHQSWLGQGISLVATFFFVVITWLFFRADTVGQAVSMMQQMFSTAESYVLSEVIQISVLPYAAAIYATIALVMTPKVVATLPLLKQLMDGLKSKILSRAAVRYPIYVGIYMAAVGLAATKLSSFIYFQF